MNKPIESSVILKETLLSRLINKKKEKLFLALTRKSPSLFLRSADIISATPQVTGVYEDRVKNLIEHFSATGQHDFLLDIGANIGLITCQSGNLFGEVHCFEPNPDCFDILRINTKMSLTKCEVYLHPYGLGLDDGSKTMKIPHANWGGGFIHDENNSYSSDELAKKEGKQEINETSFTEITIAIKKSEVALGNIFSSLMNKQRKHGIIKIDVEGYERTILKSMSSIIPNEMSCMILFENLGSTSDIGSMLDYFGKRAELYQLVRYPEKSENKITRLIKLIKNNGYYHKLERYENIKKSNDLVIVVNQK